MTSDTRDYLTRFLLRDAGVRGVHVALEDTWRQIREREAYPPTAQALLGQAVAAAALFTGHTKVDGRLSVQMRTPGAIRTLFAECTAAGTLRGIVQLAEDAPASIDPDLTHLGAGSVLAITIENHGGDGREPIRYQGLVPLESADLADAFEAYFRQSEQLPTRLLLAADGQRCAGLMVQKLPGDEGDDDGWNRVGHLFDTLRAEELSTTPAATLLTRLFHEDGVELLAGKRLAFGCSCSQERVEAMLAALGPDEAHAALQDGVATIRCEFCGQSYRFDAAAVARLFDTGADLPPPDRLQ